MHHYYDFKFNPGEIMTWENGQPCSHCGKPTIVELHRFKGGGKTWEYFAPLYHNAAENLGFCSPECVVGWMNDRNQKDEII